MLYRIAADLLVLLHLLFILFVVAGGFAVFKWQWMAALHVPAAIWGALIEYRHWVCPLTPWENKLRQIAGQEGYTEGFIEHYILPLVYPPGLTRDVQIILGTTVVVVNLLIYGVFLYRLMRN
ncbi:MAG: DUF2784 domain-containing protein [Gammaproteobacteria bacterium]